MSEREKFRTRGGYYLLTRNVENAVEEYGSLIRQYPADAAGIANLALAYFYKRDMPRALAEGQRALDIYPKNVPQRNNLALYAMYAGDFATSIRENEAVLRINPQFRLAYVGLALSQLASGQVPAARETWGSLATLGASGASMAAIGLADLAIFQGRTDEAIPTLEKGIADDLASDSREAAAAKLVALAEAELRQGRGSAAAATADRAVTADRGVNILYPAARIALANKAEAKALAIAKELSSRLEPDSQAYALLLQGEVKLSRESPPRRSGTTRTPGGSPTPGSDDWSSGAPTSTPARSRRLRRSSRSV
jgi:tetratricopeptide (TPR) repeat protein